MAGGGIAPALPGGGKVYPGNLTPYALVTCVVAAMGGLTFGYDVGISGGVTSMDSFLMRFFPLAYEEQKVNLRTKLNQYCKLDTVAMSLFTASLFAAMASSIGAATVTRKFGRKMSMLVGGILFCAGSLINGFAQNIPMLISGRFLLGFGMGFSNQATPLYLSEMAPYKYRGAFNIGFQMSITLGILAATVINYIFAKFDGGFGWRLCLGGGAVPAAIIVIGSLLLPETPNSLIERGKREDALANLVRIRGVRDVGVEFHDLVAAGEASQRVEHPWRNFFGQRKYRPHLTMSVLIPFFQQLTGVNIIIFFAPALFRTLGFASEASLMSSVDVGIVIVVATLVSIYGVDKWGRRFLLLEGGSQMFLCQIVVAIFFAVKYRVTGAPTVFDKCFASAVVLFICIYVAGFSWSWGPLGWLVPSEIFPLEIRPAAQSINTVVNMTFTFLVAQVFMPMLCRMKYGLFLVFASFVATMSVFVYFFLPETKNIPIEEMMYVWRNHWFWSRYVTDDDLPTNGDSIYMYRI
ncbi:sugar carrier protein C-like [Andrographis paniculata]|uniref:sugar carrier protein C-like n=1 Tax=Andrographis paniculata TaxID=175694 RepID=UPI0021E7EB8E|nr:sugar carrier protein C-like [Andrographis paniculata]